MKEAAKKVHLCKRNSAENRAEVEEEAKASNGRTNATEENNIHEIRYDVCRIIFREIFLGSVKLLDEIFSKGNIDLYAGDGADVARAKMFRNTYTGAMKSAETQSLAKDAAAHNVVHASINIERAAKEKGDEIA